MPHYSLYEAKTHLSALVDRAATGEAIIITKNGVAKAQLIPLAECRERRLPAQALSVDYLAEDFDAPDPRIEAMFGSSA
jgi:prevent-host-death family protein